MGIPEIIMIVVSLAAPLPVLVVLALVARRLGWLARIPRRLMPATWLAAMSVTSCATMIGWAIIHPPGQVVAQVVDEDHDTPTESMIELGSGSQWTYLYPLESWGDVPRRERIPERITSGIRARLKENEVPVRTGEEHHIPLDLFQSDEPDPAIMAHYRKAVPFTCVWGYAAITPDDVFEVHVSVDSADTGLNHRTLLKKDFSFANSPDAKERGIEEIIEAVVEAIGDP